MWFALSLAETLGYASPSRMLAEMDGQERQYWYAYYSCKADDRRDEALDARGKRALT